MKKMVLKRFLRTRTFSSDSYDKTDKTEILGSEKMVLFIFIFWEKRENVCGENINNCNVHTVKL